VADITIPKLDDVVQRLVAELNPKALYLFGSHLYGTPDCASDVDLLIVVPDDAPSGVTLAKRGYACVYDLGVPVELHFVTARRFERFRNVTGSLSREVAQRGRLLFAA
jgi:predicted nucleotidyltransferase